MMLSFLPQRHLRRFVESVLVARPKRVSHDCEKYSHEDRRPQRRNEIRCEILGRQDCFHRLTFSAKICFFGVQLETPKIENAMDRAAEQALRAGQISRRLRDFVSRGESEKRVESLSKLIEEAGALGLAGSREQNIQLRFNLNREFDLVLVDRVQIQQVLVNLFRNALEAMAHSPRRELIASNALV